jgi:hypothetical protein
MSLFSKRKKLIISGCSYTDNYAAVQKMPEFPIWGELLADKLDMDLVNLALCGYSNRAIYHTVMESMLKGNVGLVVCMWSEWQRVSAFVDIPNNEPVNRHPWRCFLPERVVKDADWHDQFYKAPTINPKKQGLKYEMSKLIREKGVDSIRAGVTESLGYMFAFQNICEQQDIKYLQVQGCQPLMGKSEPMQGIQYRELCNHIIGSPYTEKMKETFVGWPVDERIGGFSMDNILGDEQRFSSEDTHPNEEGHELMAERMFEEYEKIYA